MLSKVKFLLPILFLSLFSCMNEETLFDEYKELDGGSWKNKQKIKFEYLVKDTVKPLNLFLKLRSNNNYPFNNIFLIVKMQQPNKKVVVDTLEYQMTLPDGTLLGDGFSEIKESKLWYKENFSFSKKGKHIFEIEQANRETGKISPVKQLDGLSEIGLSIENTK